jgi:flagellar biosynthesis/type III secretory pathway protein FliH
MVPSSRVDDLLTEVTDLQSDLVDATESVEAKGAALAQLAAEMVEVTQAKAKAVQNAHDKGYAQGYEQGTIDTKTIED